MSKDDAASDLGDLEQIRVALRLAEVAYRRATEATIAAERLARAMMRDRSPKRRTAARGSIRTAAQ